MNPDIDKIAPLTQSALNLDSGEYSSDLKLAKGFYVSELYQDIILAEYIDNSGGFVQDEETGLYGAEEAGEQKWRKAIVRKVGHLVKATKVGDYIIFPNDKGLRAFTVKYVNDNGETHDAADAVMLNEWRIFAKLKKVKE